MTMTGNIDRVEVITSVQRRQRWSAEEKGLRRPQGSPASGVTRTVKVATLPFDFS